MQFVYVDEEDSLGRCSFVESVKFQLLNGTQITKIFNVFSVIDIRLVLYL